MFDSPRNNEFTQGTIFSCATAENYSDQSVCGLVITARCDAAQDKAPIYNYIPVVAITDWILFDGVEIVLGRVVADYENNLKNIISSAGLSETLIKSKTAQEIHDIHLVKRIEEDRKWLAKCAAFLECSNSLEQAKAVIESRDRELCKALLVKSKKVVDLVIRELAGNRLTGYYLLRRVPNIHDNSLGDYIALLREIHHIPSKLAKKITKGISKDDWKTAEIVGACPRFIGLDDYSMPIARLKSPWIEHLMQSLTLVFSRIGVDDVDYLTVKKSLTSIGLEGV